MGTSAEIYDYNKVLNSVLRKLRNSDIGETNKKLIERFSRYLFAQGLSQGRIIKYVIEITKVAQMLNKPFSEAGKDDIIDLVQRGD